LNGGRVEKRTKLNFLQATMPKKSDDNQIADVGESRDVGGIPVQTYSAAGKMQVHWWFQDNRVADTALAPKHTNLSKNGWGDRMNSLDLVKILLQPGEKIVSPTFEPLFLKSLDIERSRNIGTEITNPDLKGYMDTSSIRLYGELKLPIDEPLGELCGRQLIFTNQRIIIADSSYVEILFTPNKEPDLSGIGIEYTSHQLHSSILPPDCRRAKVQSTLALPQTSFETGWKNLFEERSTVNAVSGGPSANLPLMMGATGDGTQTTLEYSYFRSFPLSGIVDARLDFVSAARTDDSDFIDPRDLRNICYLFFDSFFDRLVWEPRSDDLAGCGCCNPRGKCGLFVRFRHVFIRIFFPSMLFLFCFLTFINFTNAEIWKYTKLNNTSPSPFVIPNYQPNDDPDKVKIFRNYSNNTAFKQTAKDVEGLGTFASFLLVFLFTARPLWQWVRRRFCCQRRIYTMETKLQSKRMVNIRTIDQGSLILDISNYHNSDEILEAMNGMVRSSAAFSAVGKSTLKTLKHEKKRLFKIEKDIEELNDRALNMIDEIKDLVSVVAFDVYGHGGNKKTARKILSRQYNCKPIEAKFEARRDKRAATKEWLKLCIEKYKYYGQALAGDDTKAANAERGESSETKEEDEDDLEEEEEEEKKPGFLSKCCGCIGRCICGCLKRTPCYKLCWCLSCGFICCFCCKSKKKSAAPEEDPAPAKK
jgi:hypothetical protein